jgi:broad specificity phosphatase PhoE
MPTLRRLVIASPGETEAGARLLGRRDPPLAAAGRRQVEASARWVEPPPVDLVVASPAQRAWQSAGLLAPGRPIRLVADFLDVALGRWEGRLPPEVERADPIRFPAWRAEREDAIPPGGESWPEVRRRVRRGLELLTRSPAWSALLVADPPILRLVVEELVGRRPAGDRPAPAEVGLLTRFAEGWGPGRRSSDPWPLRSAFEREGWSGAPRVGA